VKVLVAEDDALIREGLVDLLEEEGYEVVAAADGAEAWARFEAEAPEFVCLDVMMPKLSGYDVCKRIRAVDARIPVVFISAKSEELDKVLGLELGADDFIMKPFGVREVIARIRAVSRRAFAVRSTAERFTIGDLEVLADELRARRGEAAIELSLRDVKLLRVFAENPGKVLDRDRLFDAGWGARYLPSSRTLDQHISQLRKRVELDPRSPRIIKTVHGVGYRYEP